MRCSRRTRANDSKLTNTIWGGSPPLFFQGVIMLLGPPDKVRAAFDALGFTAGALTDSEVAYLTSQLLATGSGVADLWKNFLTGQGQTGSLQDMQAGWLESLGYTGDLTNKVLQFMEDGNAINVVPVQSQAEFNLSNTAYSGDESTSIQFEIVRTIRQDQGLTVDWEMLVAATTPASGTETFAAGVTVVAVSVTAPAVTGTVQGVVFLRNPLYVSGVQSPPLLGSDGISNPAITSAQFTIFDTTAPQPPVEQTLHYTFAADKTLQAQAGRGPTLNIARATVGTHYDATGTLVTAASGAARYEHNPTTFASKVLLVEEARTNLIVRSEEFDNASWVKSDASVTANTTVSPDGTTNSDTLAGVVP